MYTFAWIARKGVESWPESSSKSVSGGHNGGVNYKQQWEQYEQRCESRRHRHFQGAQDVQHEEPWVCERRRGIAGGFKSKQESGHIRPSLPCEELEFYPEVNAVLLEGFTQRFKKARFVV